MRHYFAANQKIAAMSDRICGQEEKMRQFLKLTLRTFLVSFVLCIAAFATADEKIKPLIVDGQNNHNWKGTTPVLKKILEDSGRFTVEVATTPEDKSKMGEF